jgi:hypothetical protein
MGTQCLSNIISPRIYEKDNAGYTVADDGSGEKLITVYKTDASVFICSLQVVIGTSWGLIEETTIFNFFQRFVKNFI